MASDNDEQPVRVVQSVLRLDKDYEEWHAPTRAATQEEFLKQQEDLAAWRDLIWRQVHAALFKEIPSMFLEDHRTEYNDAQTYTARVEYASELLLVTRQEYTRLKIKAGEGV